MVATTTTAARTRASKRRGLGELAQQPARGLGEQGQRPAHGLGELRDWASGGGPRASEQAAVAVRARASKGHGLSEWARQPARGLAEQRARRGLGELVRWRAGG